MRIDPIAAAGSFVERHFPACSAAVLAGSGVTGQHGPLSDLDIVVIAAEEPAFFRKIYRENGWIVECFALSPHTYREWFDAGIHSANPSLQRMLAGGAPIRCDETGRRIIEEAEHDLRCGPMPWSPAEIDHARYALSDGLRDLASSRDRCEQWFVANQLIRSVSEFMLRSNRQWIGEGKHLFRLLQAFMPEAAGGLHASMQALYAGEDIAPLTAFVHSALASSGGVLMEGFEQ